MDNYAEEIPEAMEVDSQQEELKNEERIAALEAELKQEKQKSAALQNQLTMERFGVARFTYDNKLISFYTDFATYSMFQSFYECIEPTAKNMQSMYYQSFYECIEPTAKNMQSMYYQASETISLSGRKRCMLLIDELFLFLCRLRAGLLEQDLAVRFNCSVATISRKIVTWANFLYFTLGRIPIWLSK